ncbi:MAG: hypothetical protein LDL41_00415 [Coleofasciculus sp. S288]|nr:hypothetical protein [Coleofasciculus sp. S288]
MKEIRFFVTQKNGDKYVVVKGALPKSIKLQFKVLCVQKDLEMSAVLEELIEKWIQADGPVYHSSVDLSDENSEDVKAYVPKSLKLHFKTLCTLKQVKMRSVLYELVHEWVKVQSKEVSSAGK